MRFFLKVMKFIVINFTFVGKQLVNFLLSMMCCIELLFFFRREAAAQEKPPPQNLIAPPTVSPQVSGSQSLTSNSQHTPPLMSGGLLDLKNTSERERQRLREQERRRRAAVSY